MRSLISLFGNILTALHGEISFITMTILLEQAEKVSSYFHNFICYDERLRCVILCAVKFLET